MKNKKILFLVLFTLIFTILYLIFAAKPLGKEYHYEPEWEINITNPPVQSSEKDTIYFKVSNRIGYFDEDGKITQFITYPADANAAISSEFYAVYKADARNTDFYNKEGLARGTITQAGFPFFEKDSVYVFLPGGASFSKCDNTGKVLWTYEGLMPLTAFSAKEKFTAIGTADGTVRVFDNETGEIILEYAPGGSDYGVILGIDVSENGEFIATVSGHDNQRFVLAKKENTQVRILFHEFLPKGLATQSAVYFTKDEKTVLYNFNGGIGMLNIGETESTRLEIPSRIISIEESDDLVFLLGKEKKEYTVYIIERTNSIGGSFSFTCDSAFIKASGNKLYVGKDNSLSKINISKK